MIPCRYVTRILPSSDEDGAFQLPHVNVVLAPFNLLSSPLWVSVNAGLFLISVLKIINLDIDSLVQQFYGLMGSFVKHSGKLQNFRFLAYLLDGIKAVFVCLSLPLNAGGLRALYWATYSVHCSGYV